ncbi:MAG: BrnA antitoxin family protein [Chloroflexota bacterium]|nr:BrnA antitoxin family protein [Chloroflexota bacterium]
MTTKRRKIIRPTPEEDAEINRQISEDPDDFEADEEWFKNAKPSAEIIPHILERYHREKEALESGKKERLRVLLDKEVLDYFRNQGGDWHSRINEALREAVQRDEKTKSR